MTGVIGSAVAQDAGVYVVTYIEVATGAEVQVALSLTAYASASRADPGNQRFEVVQRTAPSNQFAFIAIWIDQKSFEANRDAVHSARLAKSTQPHLIAPFDQRLHSGLAVAPRAAAPGGDKGVFILTHVDVPPPSKDKCVDALNELVAASRKESGAARFEVFQQSSRPNHFTVVEAWQSEADYLGHLVAAHTKRFRDVLTPMTGALYDERRHKSI